MTFTVFVSFPSVNVIVPVRVALPGFAVISTNLSPETLKDAQRTFSKTHNLNTLPSKSEILQTYFKLLKDWKIEKTNINY